MSVKIIPLALKKIKRRGIPSEWVEETISNPDQIVEGYRGRRVAQKVYYVVDKNMLLRVVLEDNTVVTAYLTSQIGRYWR
ncbi:MAG: DUF4258 domain-containing protein [Methanomicrobia archaeon]|nr:DUF4258 domain-containing protein [Methanomicrobia archaeon]